MKKSLLMASALVLVFSSFAHATDSDRLQKLIHDREGAIGALRWMQRNPSHGETSEMLLASTRSHIRQIDQEIQELTGQLPDESELDYQAGTTSWNDCPVGEFGYGKFNYAPFSGGPYNPTCGY